MQPHEDQGKFPRELEECGVGCGEPKAQTLWFASIALLLLDRSRSTSDREDSRADSLEHLRGNMGL